MDPNKVKYEPQVGDIVTCHRSGYWRIISFSPRGSFVDIEVELVMSRRGIRPKRKAARIRTYNAYTSKVTKSRVQEEKRVAIELWDKVAEIAMEDN
jgi:hypothetical protein